MPGRGRPKYPGVLTPRESEVLGLIREGLTNREIADRLEISVEGVKYHVSEILGKLRVSTREDAARWEGEESTRRGLLALPLMAGRTTARLSWALTTAIAVALVVGAGLLTWALLATRGEDAAEKTAMAATPIPTTEPSRGAASDPPPIDVPASTLMLALDDAAVGQGSDGLVTIVDPASGREFGHVQAGYTPNALLRPWRRQLLVSQAFGLGDDGPTVRIYDIDNLTSTPQIIEMPSRPSYIIYYQSMVLSRDERYLYYAKVHSVCPSGGDTSECDDWSIGVIELDAGREVTEIELGVGCGPKIGRQGESDVVALVFCRDPEKLGDELIEDTVKLLRLSAGGDAEEVASFPAASGMSPEYAGLNAEGGVSQFTGTARSSWREAPRRSPICCHSRPTDSDSTLASTSMAPTTPLLLGIDPMASMIKSLSLMPRTRQASRGSRPHSTFSTWLPPAAVRSRS